MAKNKPNACNCGETHYDGANYYVSVVDGPRFNVLAGPFADHAAALGWVERVNRLACEIDPKAAFYGFGTVAMRSGYNRPGMLNEQLGIGEEP